MNIRAIIFCGALSVAGYLPAAETLTNQFQQALVEEEANQNLTNAIAGYEAVIKGLDEQRPLAAAAVFRLGECYRKLGRTNDAVRAYQRVITEFSDQETLVKLSRQNLLILQPAPEIGSGKYVIKPGDSLTKIAAANGTTSEKLIELNPGLDARKLRVGNRIRVKSSADYLRELMARQSQLRARELELLSQYTPEHPFVVQVQKDLAKLDEQVARTRAELDGQAGLDVLKLQKVADDNSTLKLERDRLLAEVQQLESTKSDEERMVLIQLTMPDPQLAKVSEMIVDAKIKLAGMGDLGRANPIRQKAQSELDSLQDQAQSRIAAIMNAAKSKLQVLDQLTDENSRSTEARPTLDPAARAKEKELLEQEIALAQEQLTEDQKRFEVGKMSAEDSIPHQLDLLELKRKLAALETGSESIVRQKEFLDQEIKLVDRLIASVQNRIQIGNGSSSELRDIQRQKLQLQRELIDLDRAPVVASAESTPTPAMTADEAEELRRVQALVTNSPDLINRRDKTHGLTPLNGAIVKGYLNVMKFLLANGASLTATDGGGPSPIYSAASKGQLSALQLLLDAGADINSVSGEGTALFAAVINKNDTVTDYLLSKGADPNIEGNDGRAPLHVAAEKGYTNAIAMLLDHGADIDITTRDGVKFSQPRQHGAGIYSISYSGTPLSFAIAQEDEPTVQLLLSRGANVNPKIVGNSPLILAAMMGDTNLVHTLVKAGSVTTNEPVVEAAISSMPNEIPYLLDAGADPNLVANPNNRPPLLRAIDSFVNQWAQTSVRDNEMRRPASGRMVPLLGPPRTVRTFASVPNSNVSADVDWEAIVKALVEKGADVNHVSNMQTPLLSLMYGDTVPSQMAEWLLDHGADPNFSGGANPNGGPPGDPPLFVACQKREIELARLLLEHGAEANFQEETTGATPLFIAVQNEDLQMVELLLANGADPNGASDGKASPIYVLFDRYLSKSYSKNPNRIGSYVGPFGAERFLQHEMEASDLANRENEILAIMKALIEKGARIDRELSDGYQPVHFAASIKDTQILSLLLQSKADPNATNAEGFTPLHVAAAKDRPDAIRILIKAGADINRQDKDGDTPLHVAALLKRLESSEALIKLGADKNVTNQFGNTPSGRLRGGQLVKGIGPFNLPEYYTNRNIDDILGQ